MLKIYISTKRSQIKFSIDNKAILRKRLFLSKIYVSTLKTKMAPLSSIINHKRQTRYKRFISIKMLILPRVCYKLSVWYNSSTTPSQFETWLEVEVSQHRSGTPVV